VTVQRVGFRIRTGVVVLEVSCHVLVQIICLYFLAEVVGVCKQKPPSVTSVLTSHTIIIKVVHEHFRQLQHYETSVHGFHLHNCLFGKLDHDEIVVYVREILTVGVVKAFLMRY